MVEVHQSEEPGSELRVSCRTQPILGLPTLILLTSADLRACVPAVVPPRSSVSLKVGPLMGLTLGANEHRQTDCVCFNEH